MSTIRSFMTDDHRQCDDLFASAEKAIAEGDARSAAAAFEGFRDAMLAHFEGEETTLFPAFEARTGISAGPTQMMRIEHEQMRALMDDAALALAEGGEDDYLGIAETLLILMQQHNMKEENILYPMCDQHLEAQRSELLASLEGNRVES